MSSLLLAPTIAGLGLPGINVAGPTMVVREWSDSGPSYMHMHKCDDEAWHVLDGSLRFKFPDREVDAVAGTTVFVPAGVPHSYRTTMPSRYLVFLTPKIDRLITKLRALTDQSKLRATLAEFDTMLL